MSSLLTATDGRPSDDEPRSEGKDCLLLDDTLKQLFTKDEVLLPD